MADESSLLGDRENSREKLNAVKDHTVQGPALLKALCILICIIALCIDGFDVFNLLVEIKPISFIVNIYAGFFAFILMILELQQVFCAGMKRRLEIWMKLLSRLWGRGLCYILAGGMHIALPSTPATAIGVALMVCGVFCLIASQMAASRLNKLHDEVIGSHTDDLVFVRQTFNRFDKDQTGLLSPAELAAACKELGSEFNVNELTAIFMYLDMDADGLISYASFEEWWTGETSLSYQFV